MSVAAIRLSVPGNSAQAAFFFVWRLSFSGGRVCKWRRGCVVVQFWSYLLTFWLLTDLSSSVAAYVQRERKREKRYVVTFQYRDNSLTIWLLTWSLFCFFLGDLDEGRVFPPVEVDGCGVLGLLGPVSLVEGDLGLRVGGR